MIRTQIQLPDVIYKRAKRLAEAREISMAELMRRGLELIMDQYPSPEKTQTEWRLPLLRDMGFRRLSAAALKDLAQTPEFELELMAQTKKGAS